MSNWFSQILYKLKSLNAKLPSFKNLITTKTKYAIILKIKKGTTTDLNLLFNLYKYELLGEFQSKLQKYKNDEMEKKLGTAISVIYDKILLFALPKCNITIRIVKNTLALANLFDSCLFI